MRKATKDDDTLITFLFQMKDCLAQSADQSASYRVRYGSPSFA